MTTALFLLRCLQIGLSLRDLDMLTVGMVNELYIESRRDEEKWPVGADQELFDAF